MDIPGIKHKENIFFRFALLSNIFFSFRLDQDFIKARNAYTRVFRLFYTMANLDAEAMTQDKELLNRWNKVNERMRNVGGYTYYK